MQKCRQMENGVLVRKVALCLKFQATKQLPLIFTSDGDIGDPKLTSQVTSKVRPSRNEAFSPDSLSCRTTLATRGFQRTSRYRVSEPEMRESAWKEAIFIFASVSRLWTMNNECRKSCCTCIRV